MLQLSVRRSLRHGRRGSLGTHLLCVRLEALLLHGASIVLLAHANQIILIILIQQTAITIFNAPEGFKYLAE